MVGRLSGTLFPNSRRSSKLNFGPRIIGCGGAGGVHSPRRRTGHRVDGCAPRAAVGPRRTCARVGATANPRAIEGARSPPLWVFAYAVAAGSTLAAQTWIVKSRLRAFLGPEFGRVLPLWVVPATGVIFALIVVFLLR